jgi:hypothetical protein
MFSLQVLAPDSQRDLRRALLVNTLACRHQWDQLPTGRLCCVRCPPRRTRRARHAWIGPEAECELDRPGLISQSQRSLGNQAVKRQMRAGSAPADALLAQRPLAGAETDGAPDRPVGVAVGAAPMNTGTETLVSWPFTVE